MNWPTRWVVILSVLVLLAACQTPRYGNTTPQAQTPVQGAQAIGGSQGQTPQQSHNHQYLYLFEAPKAASAEELDSLHKMLEPLKEALESETDPDKKAALIEKYQKFVADWMAWHQVVKAGMKMPETVTVTGPFSQTASNELVGTSGSAGVPPTDGAPAVTDLVK